MKEKIKKFLSENGRSVILAIFILELILTVFITPNKYDDEFFIEKATNNSVFKFVTERYSEWTSRVIIEYVLCTVLKTSKYLWILIQSFMMAVIGYSISEIFIKEEKNDNNLMLLYMILLYPLNIMASAGWAATSVNYVWPLSMCLYSLIPLKKAWYKEKIKPYEFVLYSLALIFAGNQEHEHAHDRRNQRVEPKNVRNLGHHRNHQ